MKPGDIKRLYFNVDSDAHFRVEAFFADNKVISTCFGYVTGGMKNDASIKIFADMIEGKQ